MRIMEGDNQTQAGGRRGRMKLKLRCILRLLNKSQDKPFATGRAKPPPFTHSPSSWFPPQPKYRVLRSPYSCVLSGTRTPLFSKSCRSARLCFFRARIHCLDFVWSTHRQDECMGRYARTATTRKSHCPITQFVTNRPPGLGFPSPVHRHHSQTSLGRRDRELVLFIFLQRRASRVLAINNHLPTSQLLPVSPEGEEIGRQHKCVPITDTNRPCSSSPATIHQGTKRPAKTHGQTCSQRNIGNAETTFLEPPTPPTPTATHMRM